MESSSAVNDSGKIAIIGMAGRFPGAKNIEQFWENLRNGVESIIDLSDEELEAAGIDRALLNNSNYVKRGTVLEGVDLFDASFFGFTPREAEISDPQHRLFLEVAWEALERAGYDTERYTGSVGVFAGAGMNYYFLANLSSNRDLMNAVGGFQLVIENDKDFLPTRASYKLNLNGPSVAVQTACSTSLIAVHIGCQSLLNGECDMVLAGGVSIVVPQRVGYIHHEGGISSPDGHCRAFDAKAQGTVGGSGVGVVILKKLEDAIADRDNILAVIAGSAVNNDGSSKIGFTAPSVEGQAKVITEAQAMACVDASSITYVEAHGTGTVLGDPVEVAGLIRSFEATTDQRQFCAIGSVKTNVGHLDAAAGVAGLIKTVLALQHKMLPPSLHFEQPNSRIDFENSPFYVNATLSQWNTEKLPRRAGVSSFGIGGTNAHVILEEFPTARTSETTRPWHLLMLSAKTPTALEAATTNLIDYLKRDEMNLADVAYTLQVGRRSFEHRRFIICDSAQSAIKTMEQREPKRVLTGARPAQTRPIVFMFPGQGSQYVNMGKGLYESEPVFREVVDHCCGLLKSYLGFDLRDVLYPDQERGEEAKESLKQTCIAQPALFIIEYATARLWMSWGVRPQAMIGHSIGEYVAATIAQVLPLEDCLKLVAVRGRLMQQLPEGAMLTIRLPEKDVWSLIGNRLSVAAINGPSLCVVSGHKEDVAQLRKQLAAIGAECRYLHTSHAFHSEMMEPIMDAFAGEVKRVPLNDPAIPYISNLTGTWMTGSAAIDPGYWAGQLRQTVRFSDGLQELIKEPCILLEVGPGQSLSMMARQHLSREEGNFVLASMRSPQEDCSDLEVILKAIGKLWIAGEEIDWNKYYLNENRRRVVLPTYPFERQRYWVEPQKDNALPQTFTGKKQDVADWFYAPVWRQSVTLKPVVSGESGDSCWLVFLDENGLGAQIVERLKDLGHEVYGVIAGQRFSEVADGVYSINPVERFDYSALLRHLRRLGKFPTDIVHLWAATSKADAQTTVESFEREQSSGLYSLLYLSQSLAEQSVTDPLYINVISSDMQQVTGFEVCSPEKATLGGACKVIPQEYPNIICRSIDINVPEPDSKRAEKITGQITAEIVSRSSDLVIAYRGNHRWVQQFDRVLLTEQIRGKSRLREGGVYLITGGLGSLALLLAERIAKVPGVKLLLVGHSPFPARAEWEQWLSTHHKQDETSNKILRLQAIEMSGAEIMIAAADVADQEQMQSVVDKAYDLFGHINGVIHAAGIVGERSMTPIEETTSDECGRHFQAKVYGTLVLERIFDDKKLDFCLLMSSLSTVLGGLGFFAYSSANLFMDALANKRSAIHCEPWVSVYWDGWRYTDDAEPGLQRITEFSIKPSEGVEAFERVLSLESIPNVVVSTGDLDARIDRWINLKSLRATRPEESQSLTLHPRPELLSTYIEPRGEVEQALASIWQRTLGIEQVGIADNFFELGGDSLMAVQVISGVRESFEVEVPIRDFFNGPTIKELARGIEKTAQATQDDVDKIARMLDIVEGMSDDEAKMILASDALSGLQIKTGE
jgi:acyl transferase domain-containing protein/acyl carrier protein